MNQLMTSQEVAEVLRVHPATVRRWVLEGKIQAMRLPGGEYRIRASELDKLVTPMQVTP